MPNVNAAENLPYVFKSIKSPKMLDPEGQDIWFDAIDWVEMNETWFDASNELCSQPLIGDQNCDTLAPFTEDCRRCIRQLVVILSDYKQGEILSACLSKLLPGLPVSIGMAANSLYTAIMEKKYIDIAVLHSLGLASRYLPDDLNVISQIADFIRTTVSNLTDDTFLHQFLGEGEQSTSDHFYSALAIAVIAARYWVTDSSVPQRRMLKVPAFIANLFIRVSHYWHALGNMVHHPQPVTESDHADLPAFEVETYLEISRDLALSRNAITVFSSNSTARPEAYIRATVNNRPRIVEQENNALADKAHALVLQRLKQESGLSELLYCKTHKTETQRTTNDTEITHTWINTRCDAVCNPQQFSKDNLFQQDKTEIPESQVSAADNHAGDTLLPLVITAAAVPLATSYMQSLRSKTMIAAGSLVATGGLALGGKLLWDSIQPYSPDKAVEDKMIQRKMPAIAPKSPGTGDVPPRLESLLTDFIKKNEKKYQASFANGAHSIDVLIIINTIEDIMDYTSSAGELELNSSEVKYLKAIATGLKKMIESSTFANDYEFEIESINHRLSLFKWPSNQSKKASVNSHSRVEATYDIDINDNEFTHHLYSLISNENIKNKVRELIYQYESKHLSYNNKDMMVAIILPLINFMENSKLTKDETGSGLYILSFFLNKVASSLSEETSKEISRRMKSIFVNNLADERADEIISTSYNHCFIFLNGMLEITETTTIRDKVMALMDAIFKKRDKTVFSMDTDKALAVEFLRRFVKFMLAKASILNIQEKYEAEYIYYSFLKFISSLDEHEPYYKKINKIQSMFQIYKQIPSNVLRYDNLGSQVLKIDFIYEMFFKKIEFYIKGLTNDNFNIYEIYDQCIHPLKSAESAKVTPGVLLSKFINQLYNCQKDFVEHHYYKEIREILRDIVEKSLHLASGNINVSDMSILLDKSLPAIIDAMAHKATKRIVDLYNPIINPAFFLNQEVVKKIKSFEIERQLNTGLTPETKINVYYKKACFSPFGVMFSPAEIVVKSKSYSLQEVVCGYHELELNKGDIVKIEHSDIIEYLRKGDRLHDIMLDEFASQMNNELKIEELKKYLNASVTYRCTALLSIPSMPDNLKQAIKNFLLGKQTATTLSFHGHPLNGAIVIHQEDAGRIPISFSLLIDLDSPNFFVLVTLNEQFSPRDKYSVWPERKFSSRNWPENKDFKQWVLHKIPSRYHQHYLKDKDAFNYDYYKRNPSISDSDPIGLPHYSLPFFYNNEFTLTASPDVLATDLKRRWEMDIEDLYLTEDKLKDIERLELIRLITQIGSCVVPLLYAVPGAGAVIATVAIGAVEVGMASAYITADILLAKEYPDDQMDKAYIEDAIITGLFMVFGEMTAGQSSKLFSEVLFESKANALPLANSISQKFKPQVRRILALSKNEKVAESTAVLTKGIAHDATTASRVEAETAHVLSPESREMIKRMKKPHKEHFTVEGVFDEEAYNKAFDEYKVDLKKRYLSQQTSSLSSDEFERRKIQANTKLSILRQNHPDILKELHTEDLGAFSVTTIKNDPATTLVLSSHGWFTKNSPNALIPRGKYITFLGPHGQTLREIESLDLLTPTETLFTQEFSIYSRLANKESLIRGELTEALGSAKNRLEASGTDKLGFVCNYNLKNYEKTPLEEVKAAVVANRVAVVTQQAKNIIKMDMLIPSSLAGGITLKDVINEMKPGGRLAQYQNLYYYACREEKVPFTLQSVSSGLHSHDIKLNIISSDPLAPAQLNEEFPVFLETIYDGYFLFTLVNITKDGDGFIVNESVVEMQPYKFEDDEMTEQG